MISFALFGNWAMKCYSEIMKREEVGCWPTLLRLVSGFRVPQSWGLSDAALWASSGVGAAELRAGPAVVRRARQSKAFLCCFVSWSEGRLRESPSLKWMRGVEFRVPRNNPCPLFFTLRQLWLRGPCWESPAVVGPCVEGMPLPSRGFWCGGQVSHCVVLKPHPRGVLGPHTPLPSPALPPPWLCYQRVNGMFSFGEL